MPVNLSKSCQSIESASIKCERQGDACRVSLAGTLTIDSSPELRNLLFERLRAPDNKRVIVDFGGIDYIDTSGLAILIETLRAARAAGKSMYLSRLGEQPWYLLDATRLLHLFDEVSAS